MTSANLAVTTTLRLLKRSATNPAKVANRTNGAEKTTDRVEML